MIDAIELYNDVAIDNANKDQNGPFSYEKFNRISWRAQVRLMDWLTGNAKEGAEPPAPINQKNKDFLSPFIETLQKNATDGKIDKPADFYTWQAGNKLNGTPDTDCDDEDEDEEYNVNCDTPIELLSIDQFQTRCETHIEEMKPSFKKPIAKLVKNTFIFLPSDIGPVSIEYVRYPNRAVIRTKFDAVYNDQVPDPATTDHFEWEEWARELLIWFITDTWANHTREQALKQFNAASRP